MGQVIEMSESERLARIETRIDTMTTAVNELKELMARMVRVEEKYIYTDDAVKRIGRAVDSIENRVIRLENQAANGSGRAAVFERIGWATGTGVLGIWLAKLKGWV